MNIVAEGGFNSGRMYRAEGQRIYWALREDGWLFFNDIDRMIYGWIDMGNANAEYPEPDILEIMRKYDNSDYRFSFPGQDARNPDVPDDFDYGIKRRL
jgi:hypothetical protein